MDRVQTDFIAPLHWSATIDSVEVTISPLRVRQIPAAIGFVTPLIDEIVLAPPEVLAVIESGKVDADQAGDVMAWLADLVRRHAENVFGIVALATGQTTDWVGDLYMDRLVAVLMGTIEVNADFFVRMLPGAKQHLVDIKARVAHALTQTDSSSTGRTPSSS